MADTEPGVGFLNRGVQLDRYAAGPAACLASRDALQ